MRSLIKNRNHKMNETNSGEEHNELNENFPENISVKNRSRRRKKL